MNGYRFKTFALRLIFEQLAGAHYPIEIERLILWLYYKSLGIKLSCGAGSSWVIVDSKVWVWDHKNRPTSHSLGVPIRKIKHAPHHSLALDCQGRVWAWGSNNVGQLGLGDDTDASKPTRLSLSRVRSIDCAAEQSVALTESDQVYFWGSDQRYDHATLIPTEIDLMQPAKNIRCGGYHLMALDRLAKIWVWGANTCQQLSLPYIVYQKQPTELNLQSIRKIRCGSSHVLALTTDFDLYAWGFNDEGQLGNGNKVTTGTPTKLLGLPPIFQIECGLYHSMALAVDYRLYVWGSNRYGQLGLPSASEHILNPTELKFPHHIIKINCKNDDSMILTADLSIYRLGFGFGTNIRKLDSD